MAKVKVELYCKNEDRVVADIEIQDGEQLNQYLIKRGLTNRVVTHCPPRNEIKDGVALNCRCGAPLWFRTQLGDPGKSDLVLAIPGLGAVEA